jgi:hypothetical protein
LALSTGCSAAARPKIWEPKGCSPADSDPRLFDVQNIEEVTPLFDALVVNKGVRLNRLRGATVRIRGLPGLSSEWIERALLCRQALALRGRLDPTTGKDDPYLLAGIRIGIRVEGSRASYLVHLHGGDAAAARAILEKALSFARRRVSG